MSLDILFIYHNFISDLPDTYVEFVEGVNQSLPYLFDNKVIAMHLRKYIKKLPNFTEGLYQQLMSKNGLQTYNRCKLNPDPAFGKYGHDKSFMHEAGFDAYISGMVFIAMVYFL